MLAFGRDLRIHVRQGTVFGHGEASKKYTNSLIRLCIPEAEVQTGLPTARTCAMRRGVAA
jgi:hypothetical protein